MKTLRYFKSQLSNNHGAVIVLVVFLIVLLLGIAAFAIDFGYRHLVRNELQNAADAAALAATRELGVIYKGMDYDLQQIYVADPTTIKPIALQAAFKNYAGDVASLVMNNGDVAIGIWDYSADPSIVDPFSANLNQPNAVRVIARRDSYANGPITTFFAQVLNINTMEVSAIATAALGGQSEALPGEIELPVGISKYWFDNNSCNDVIAFAPSNDPASCAGWHTFDQNSNDATIRTIINGGMSNPYTIAGQTSYSFIGGQMSNPTFDALLSAFQSHGYDVSAPGTPILDQITGEPITNATGEGSEIPLCESINGGLTACTDPDSNGTVATYPDGTPRNMHEWPTTVPVYNRDDCSNPNQSIEIIGFAYVVVNDVFDAPDKTIRAEVLCNYVQADDVRSGANNYGPLGSIPALVQ